MSFNPFTEKCIPLEKTFMNWDTMQPKSYNKESTDPYTKCRIVLMNGTEFEAQWFTHNFTRHMPDNELRKELAVLRRGEQQQQKRISALKPKNETILEHTITYEQLAVDLTCALAKMEKDKDVKNALDFALLEDFDHLYRYGNLLYQEYGIYPEKLVGCFTEMTPGRPTISEHRHPADSVFRYIDNKTADLQTKLNVGIITAAEQQTMNYYMNVANLYDISDIGRRLYQEIGMIEEQHVTQYGSLMDTRATWLECLLMHQYTECYLYYSNLMTESDPYIRNFWEECLIQEIAHLNYAKDLLWKYEKKTYQEVVGDGTFPSVLDLGSNIDYVRDVLATSVGNTQKDEYIVPLGTLNENDRFFIYQDIVNTPADSVASHKVIERGIRAEGKDYRFEIAPNPVEFLRDRTKDNTTLGRVPEDTPPELSRCGTSDFGYKNPFEIKAARAAQDIEERILENHIYDLSDSDVKNNLRHQF